MHIKYHKQGDNPMSTVLDAAPAVIRSSSLTRSLQVNPLTCSIGAELTHVHLGAAA